jgi:hypothetical protein
MGTRRYVSGSLALLLLGCGGPQGREGSLAGASFGGVTYGGEDGEFEGSTSAGLEPDSTNPDAGAESTADGATADPPSGVPSWQTCSFEATDYGDPLQMLDVPEGSAEALTFQIPGLPPPGAVGGATLHFETFDADHPGEEGTIRVNGDGPYDLPADAGADNLPGAGVLDVTSALVEGLNTVEFGPGTVATGTYYAVGNVRIELEAEVVDCPPAPPVLPADETVHFLDAQYTKRHNWVLRCDGFEYAYTAGNAKHVSEDCHGLYNPDGSRSGTATFSFTDLAAATYEVQVHSRHTTNRNPAGALFIVDGVEGRVFQDDDADFVTDVWGEIDLEGDVDVVLDSSDSGSDSVIWVRLHPVG